ncbi:hypothetical protein BGW41_008396 [Actinomortierella wolfii]|nr:hypothetical protein BGW41_008396 [Actinomortierella wolfii]
MLRSTDQTSVDDDQSAVHDGNDDSDEDSESNSDTSHITFDQEQNLNARIPDDFTDDEMSLIRRQLDALVRLEELRLDGEAMSYDLLMVPRSPHDHSSESSTSPHLSHQSEGEECITTQDGENPEVKRLQKREYRAIRPLSNGNLSSIRIMTDVYFPDSTGMYQRPSIPSSHETLKKKEIMESV